MSFFPVLLLLLCSSVQAQGPEMKLFPKTGTVLCGEESRFTCSTMQPLWGAMIWQLRGKTILTIVQHSDIVLSSNPNITAEKYSSSSEGQGWTLVLRNTQRLHEGEVSCDLQDGDKKTAQLFVQEKGNVSVLGETKLALKGHFVKFECQAAGWHPQPTLHWELNGRKMSSEDFNVTSEVSGQGLYSLSSNLSVTASSSCDVHCLASVSAMRTPLQSTFRLTVVAEVLEEEEEESECVVPVALLASLSALLLLTLLCICTVLCLRQRRRTKPGLQQAIRISQSETGRMAVAGVTGGKVNLGYSNDSEPYSSELHNGAPHPVSTFSSQDKGPYFSWSCQTSQNNSQCEDSTTNSRNITTV